MTDPRIDFFVPADREAGCTCPRGWPVLGRHHGIECGLHVPGPQLPPQGQGLGILRPRSDEDGEPDPRLSDARAALEYGGRDVD